MQIEVNIKKYSGTYNSWRVEFKGITLGMILAMQHALELYKEQSQVANDVYAFLSNSMQQNNVNQDTKL